MDEPEAVTLKIFPTQLAMSKNMNASAFSCSDGNLEPGIVRRVSCSWATWPTSSAASSATTATREPLTPEPLTTASHASRWRG